MTEEEKLSHWMDWLERLIGVLEADVDEEIFYRSYIYNIIIDGSALKGKSLDVIVDAHNLFMIIGLIPESEWQRHREAEFVLFGWKEALKDVEKRLAEFI